MPSTVPLWLWAASELGNEAAVYTSEMYLLDGVDLPQAERIAVDLLANSVIQTVKVEDHATWRQSPSDLTIPRVAGGKRPALQAIDLSGSDAELLRISREGLLALNLDEMRAIRDHFKSAAEDPRRRRLSTPGAAPGPVGAPTGPRRGAALRGTGG